MHTQQFYFWQHFRANLLTRLQEEGQQGAAGAAAVGAQQQQQQQPEQVQKG